MRWGCNCNNVMLRCSIGSWLPEPRNSRKTVSFKKLSTYRGHYGRPVCNLYAATGVQSLNGKRVDSITDTVDVGRIPAFRWRSTEAFHDLLSSIWLGLIDLAVLDVQDEAHDVSRILEITKQRGFTMWAHAWRVHMAICQLMYAYNWHFGSCTDIDLKHVVCTGIESML